MNDHEFTENALPFSEDAQRSLLGHLLIKDTFALQSRDKILPKYFISPYAQKIWRAVITFLDTYQRVPTVEEVLNTSEIATEDPGVKNRIETEIKLAVAKTAGIGLDTITPKLTEWLHAVKIKTGVKEVTELFNRKQISQACEAMGRTVRDISDTRFEDDGQRLFSNFQNDFDSATEELQGAITFGLSSLDRVLCPHAEKGALLRGDTTVLIAPLNIGKTSTMITVARHNLMAKRHVLLLTHEGRPQDIMEKVWCSTLNVTKGQLFELYKTQAGQEKLNKAAKFLDTYLTYVPMNKAGLKIAEVESVIRRKQEELMAKNGGQGFSLVIDDYPAKLHASSSDVNARRIVETMIYDYFVQLALEYKFHSLVAIQTNREGSKINKGMGDESRLLTPEDVAETFGVPQIATNVITLNRNMASQAANRMTLYVSKSRSSETGFAVVARTCFANCITHWDKLGSTVYRGTSTMDDRIEELMQSYNNGTIPEGICPY